MKYLLDAHAFLWAVTEDERLSPAAAQVFTDTGHELLLSAATIWEILTKVQIGKLPLPLPAGNFIRSQLAANDVHVLPVRFEHVLRLEQIPLHHRDPFDRMLVAQAMEEKLPILSCDPWFEKYPVKVIW
jgi:PIN domain nuclease of toxin-antitoxin system